ncbi:hypothetical protein [Mariniflexile sp. AS56]|uniref:hypothetical protein n=1 Tax=Mariniflexile sp. AS56 TaxID=3063957 RepID=UPI0026ECF62B|nr:hypothetical protein [Mariniflexile sp. AS56]MDO7171182.1 hypothetical protein [Mariniflexile sp. AS56]
MEKKEEITNAIKLIPSGAVFVTLCSSINLIIYYGMFNIRIIDYLTIKEYASLFMEHILVYLIIILGGYICHLIFNKWLSFLNKWSVIFGILCGIIANLVIFFISNNIYEKINDISYVFYLIIFLTFYLKQLKTKDLNPLIYLMIIALLFSIFSGFSKGYRVKEKGNDLEYNFKFKDNAIRTSKKKLYLGKTEKHIFLYEINSKTARIVDNQNLLETLIIRKN